MLSGASGLVASALPVVCVIAGTSLVALAIVAWLVRDVAVRAIARAKPDQVAAVIVALASLITPFHWIWPWSARTRTARRQEDNDSRTGPSAGGQA
jgi:hypothetical protein